MKSFFVVVLLSFTAISLGQTPKIQWGEYDKYKGMPTSNILPISENEFFDLNFKPQAFALTFSTMKFFPLVRYFKNKKLVKEIQFKGTAPGKNESYEYFVLIGEKAMMFTTTREKDETGFYVYEIDQSLNIGKPRKLMNHKKESKESFYFTLQVSENKEHFAILVGMEDKKNDVDKFEYQIFDKDFNPTIKGSYTLPYGRKECDISQHHISNTGEYFVTYKVYETNERGKVKDYSKLKKYVVRQIGDGNVDDYEIKPKNGSVRDVHLISNEQGTLTLTGLWGTEARAIQGVFNMIIDFKNKNILTSNFQDFSKEFILNAWPTRSKEKFEKKEKSGKIKPNQEPALTNYVFRDMIPQKDGGSIVLLEQSYVVERTTTDSKGNTRTYYVYNENGVIAYKIEPDGNIGWVTYINKEQSTTNDGGYAISFGHIWNEDRLVLFFHDNINNYTNSKYNGKRERVTFMKKKYCFAQASIDTKTGEISRTMIHDLKTGEGFVLPRQTSRTSDSNTGIMVMVKKFNKAQKRYGSVSI